MAAALLALSACSSTQDVLEPSAITPPSASGSPASAPPTQPVSPNTTASTTQPQGASDAALNAARIQFAPIVGTSVEAATTLSERLTSQARSRGVRMAGGAEQPTLVLRGYFTPLVEGKETTVIFVWDVYDLSGNRIHRISGQQKSATTVGEGWAAVPAASMQAIGDTTIDQLAAWLSARTG